MVRCETVDSKLYIAWLTLLVTARRTAGQQRNMQASPQPPLGEGQSRDRLRHCDGEMNCMDHSFRVTEESCQVETLLLSKCQHVNRYLDQTYHGQVPLSAR